MKPARGRRAKRGLFIVIADYPGGAERVTFSLASELASRPDWTVEVEIVTSQLPQSFSKEVLPPHVRVTYGRLRNWHLAFPFLPFRLLFGRYDLVFTTHVYTNALVSLMRRWRLLRTGRLVLRESTTVFDRFTGLKAKRFRLLYRAYGAEDLIVAQTRYMADHVRPWLPSRSAAKVRVLANPVNVAEITAAAAQILDSSLHNRLSNRRNLLFCGRLIEVKAPQVALEAFRLIGDLPDLQLVIMGAGPLEETLRERASEADMNDRVLFVGNRPNPYPVMAACDYGIVTSMREGFPNVLIEMMACGARKVLTTPCAGDLDLLSDVTITKTFEAAEVAAALRSAIHTGEDRSDAYRTFAKTRSTAAYLDAVLELA